MKFSYFILICILTLVDFILLAVSVRHKDKLAVKSFIVMLILSAVAHICYGASLIIPWPDAKFFVHEMKFLGVAFFSTAFYKMYMDLFEMPRWADRRHILMLMIIPTTAAILAVTNNSHHLFRESLWIVNNDFGSFIGVKSGPLFWVYTVYSYVIYMLCICVVMRIYLKTPKLYRVQISIMIYAAISTLLCNFISISGLLFKDFGDATLVIFGVAEIIQFYGLVMYKPVRVIHMARSKAFSEIEDPAVVFDYMGKLFDFNGAAAQLFDLADDDNTEISVFLCEKLNILEEPSASLNWTQELNGRWYSISFKRINDTDGVFTATALIMSDITELKRREHELEDMAYLDSMTGIANRHAYMRALSETERGDLPVAVLRFGVSGMALADMSEGDAVISHIVGTLTEAAGSSGFCAHIEGDEFALLLKNTDESAARDILGRIVGDFESVALVGGMAVMKTTMENINIIDKAALNNLYMQYYLAVPSR